MWCCATPQARRLLHLLLLRHSSVSAGSRTQWKLSAALAMDESLDRINRQVLEGGRAKGRDYVAQTELAIRAGCPSRSDRARGVGHGTAAPAVIAPRLSPDPGARRLLQAHQRLTQRDLRLAGGWQPGRKRGAQRVLRGRGEVIRLDDNSALQTGKRSTRATLLPYRRIGARFSSRRSYIRR